MATARPLREIWICQFLWEADVIVKLPLFHAVEERAGERRRSMCIPKSMIFEINSPSPTPSSWEREKNRQQCQDAPDSCRQKLLGLAMLAGLAVLANGCAAVAPASSALGNMNSSATLQIFNTTDLRLQQKNFEMVKPNVIGQSRGFSLLGIITIVPARFVTAMNRLNAQADLKPGSSRTLANLVLEKNSSYFILFSLPRTSIRADVIEFVPDVQPQPSSVGGTANARQ